MSSFVTADFLRSPEYTRLMMLHVPPGPIALDEMEQRTKSAYLRHRDLAPLLGVWRWRGMQRHAEAILCEMEREGGRVLDFGGAGGPLGLGSMVVDLLERDAQGNTVSFHSLDQVRHFRTREPVATCVFTSHALEHVPDLDAGLAQIAACLAPSGLLIAHVPAYTCVRWRVGVHTNAEGFGEHCWDFGLTDEAPIPGLRAYTNIAARIAAAGLAVELAEYCGDDSIMVMARKVEA